MAGVNGKGKAVAMQGDKRQSHELVGASSSRGKRRVVGMSRFAESRKRRRGNQRRASVNPLVFRSSTSRVQPLPIQHPPRAINPWDIRYLFQKQLKNSDVGPTCRIVLPKKGAETHLPALDDKQGLLMNMDDMDGRGVWSFKFRFWPNNHSRMYILENTGEFVRAHDLRRGDYIMVYRDDQNEKYVIRAMKGSNQDTDPQISGMNSQVPPEYEENYSLANFPTIDEMGSWFVNDNIFHDFPGGSLPDLPKLEQMPSLGSLSFSPDDFS